MKHLVRAYRVEDRTAVKNIAKELPGFFDPHVADYICLDAESHHAAVCSNSDGSVYGFVVWIETSFEVEIVWVGVRASTQRRGAGASLVEFVLRSIDSNKIVVAKVGKLQENTSYTKTVYDDLSKAEAFWNGMGFEAIGLLTSFWGDGNDALVMRYTKGAGDDQELNGTQ